MDGLFSSPWVQTAIALAVVWFVAALVCSGIVQLVGLIFGFKAKHLWSALASLLQTESSCAKPKRQASEAGSLLKRLPTPDLGTPFARAIQVLPGVTRDTIARTPYIERQAAVAALTHAASVPTGTANEVSIRGEFAATPLGRVVAELPPAITSDAMALRTWFEQWFDDQMEQLSRSYRGRIRWYTAVVGIGFAILLHVDSLHIARELYNKPATRQILVAEAQRITSDDDGPATGCAEQDLEAQASCIEGELAKFESFDVIRIPPTWPKDQPIGWQVFGLAVTAGAIAAGAPFWYDVLRRLMGLRPKDPPRSNLAATQG